MAMICLDILKVVCLHIIIPPVVHWKSNVKNMPIENLLYFGSREIKIDFLVA